MDATKCLLDALERTAPFYNNTGFSRLRCAEDAKTRMATALTRDPFHRDARHLASAIAEVASTAARADANRSGGTMQAELATCIKQFQSKLKDMQRCVHLSNGTGHPHDDAVGTQANANLRAHRAGVLLIVCNQMESLGKVQKDLLARDMAPKSLLWSSRSVKPKTNANNRGRRIPMAAMSGIRSESGVSGEGGDRATDEHTMQLQEENRSLLEELLQTHDSVQTAEKTLVEISSLNSIFSTQIREQAEQLENLLDESLHITTNFKRGNIELDKTLERNKSGSKYIICIIIFAALGLLFLDWYQS